MGLLDVTLATDSLIGTNLRGGASGGGWLYALPRLSYDDVVCLGAPGSATLAGLARAGRRVTVLVASPMARSRLGGLVRAHGWAHVTVRAWRRSDGQASDRIDLLAVFDHGAAARRRAVRLQGRLTGDGVAYYTSRPPDGVAGAGAGQRVTLSLTPSHGEVRTIVPTDDTAMRASFRRLGLHGTILSRPKLARWEREVTTLLRLEGPRRSATLVGGPHVDLSGAPAYVRAVAAADDMSLDGWSFGVSARGNYDSQKILVLLTPAGASDPTVVVKVTRSQAHAARLQNEAAILRQVARLGVSAGRTPVPWFSGFHAGRAVLGMSLMEGLPYVLAASRAGRAPDGEPASRLAHSQLADALGWLTDLAEETAHPTASAQVAAVLLTLLDRFERVYAPPQAESDALREEFERLGALDRTLPIVVQHGDPGIWNLLVDDDGRTVFLDWESGESDGMPLWDLFYLFRSHAVEAARQNGNGDRVEAAVSALTGRGALPDLLVEAVKRYCARVGLPVETVQPLLLGCWLHRALKEAGRSSAHNLDEGLSVRLLRRLLAEPDAPARVRLRPPT